VLSATIAFARDDVATLLADVRDHLRWRKEGTPFSERCCGSVFRNPGLPGAAGGTEGTAGAGLRTAGQLIDACGLKGFRIGGAEVSRRHANYVVNTGGASAGDVLRVIETVRNRVKKEFGLELQLEVKIVK
jgi:UDP-N-acetylmuramate dehydrogenase